MSHCRLTSESQHKQKDLLFLHFRHKYTAVGNVSFFPYSDCLVRSQGQLKIWPPSEIRGVLQFLSLSLNDISRASLQMWLWTVSVFHLVQSWYSTDGGGVPIWLTPEISVLLCLQDSKCNCCKAVSLEGTSEDRTEFHFCILTIL